MNFPTLVTFENVTFNAGRIEGYCSDRTRGASGGTKVWFESGESVIFSATTSEFSDFLDDEKQASQDFVDPLAEAITLDFIGGKGNTEAVLNSEFNRENETGNEDTSPTAQAIAAKRRNSSTQADQLERNRAYEAQKLQIFIEQVDLEDDDDFNKLLGTIEAIQKNSN